MGIFKIGQRVVCVKADYDGSLVVGAHYIVREHKLCSCGSEIVGVDIPRQAGVICADCKEEFSFKCGGRHAEFFRPWPSGSRATPTTSFTSTRVKSSAKQEDDDVYFTLGEIFRPERTTSGFEGTITYKTQYRWKKKI